jgi:ActR/RegA family two-component response regulator
MLETVPNGRTMEFVPQLTKPAVRLHLLVVDADPPMRSACVEIATSLGYAVESTGDLGQARSLLRGRAADILLVNLPTGNNHGLELVAEVKLLYPETAVIAMTASGSVNAAVEAMRCGATDYLSKPFAIDELSTVLERAAATHVTDTATRQLRERLRLSPGRHDWPLWRDGKALSHPFQSCPVDAPGAGAGGEWNRKRTGRAHHPCVRAKFTEAVSAR